MSLISFHRFLIVTAIIFCGGFAAWEFNAAAGGGGGAQAFLMGSVFTVFALALSVYLRHLGRFLGYDKGSGHH